MSTLHCLLLASALLLATAFLSTASAVYVYYASPGGYYNSYYSSSYSSSYAYSYNYNCGYYGCGSYYNYNPYPYGQTYYPGYYPTAGGYHTPYEPHEWERPYGRPLCYLRGSTWQCYY